MIGIDFKGPGGFAEWVSQKSKKRASLQSGQ